VAEWDSNQGGSIETQRARWLRLGEIARRAAPAAAPAETSEPEPGLLPEEEVVRRTGFIASVTMRPDLVIEEDAAPDAELRERCEALAAKWDERKTRLLLSGDTLSAISVGVCADELRDALKGER